MSYSRNLVLALAYPREYEKLKKAVRNQIHFVHKAHWHEIKPGDKRNRRLNYWSRVYAKLSTRAEGLQAHFSPGKPRGKRKAAYDAFLEREERAWFESRSGAPRLRAGASRSPAK